MSELKALFLVEAGKTAGLGHLRRMQVLAGAMRELGWHCKFGVSDVCVLEELRLDGYTGAKWEGTGLELGPIDVLVIDGYKYRPSILESWKRYSRTIMVLDDIAARPIESDILLNHNIYGHRLDYSAYNVRHLLTGPEFSLVDNRFLEIKDCDKTGIPRILVSFGGTDDGRLSGPVAAGILDINNEVVVDVVISPFCNADTKLNELIKKYPSRIVVHSGADMVSLMQRCTIIVGAAGFTIIEALAAGLTPAVCSIADNQKLNIKELQALGFRTLDHYDSDRLVNEAITNIATTISNRDTLIDGKGASRVINCIKQSIHEGSRV